MTRRRISLLLAAGLLVPLQLSAQERQARRGGDPGGRAGAADEAQVFLETFRGVRDYALTTMGDSILWEKAIQGLISQLDDPYAAVFSPVEVDEFNEETTGNYAGIGVQITDLNDAVTITGVFRATPAYNVGLQVGDVIIGVDGEDATEWTSAIASDNIRGEVGTIVEISIARQGFFEAIPHTIRRDQVHVSSITAAMVFDSIGYILLDRVARGSAQELDSALVLLEDSKGIIIDLRRNPGGYFDESLNMADLFVSPGQVLAQTKSRTPTRPDQTVDESYRGRVAPTSPGKPIVVLVDRFTASAAEILAGALQDYDLAAVLGERTFGKGVMQTILPLPHGRQLRLTTGEWYTPRGRSLHIPRSRTGRIVEVPEDTGEYRSESGRKLRGGGGIVPDYEVRDDTLKLKEREVLRAINRASVSLPVKIAEYAFEEARKTEGQVHPNISEAQFEEFITTLVEAGVPADALTDPVARDYLDWRLRVVFHQRRDAEGASVEARAERDVVLREAVDLLLGVGDLDELFAAAESAQTMGSSSRGQ